MLRKGPRKIITQRLRQRLRQRQKRSSEISYFISIVITRSTVYRETRDKRQEILDLFHEADDTARDVSPQRQRVTQDVHVPKHLVRL